MWNKPARDGWKEVDQDSISEKPATASSSEAPGNNLGAKRQRRPSVRLEEIGDRPAAVLAEKRKKKTVFFASSREVHPKPGDVPTNLEVHEPLESDVASSFKTGKVIKARSLIHVNNANFHEHFSSDEDGGVRERQTVSHTELASPCSTMPVENWLEPHPASDNANNGNTLPQFLKIISKKGRNGNRRRGGSKAAASVKQLSSTARPAGLTNAERVPDMKDAKDMHSDEDHDACTPEGFRDCDLETSDYLNDAKEMSNSHGSKASREGDMSPVKDQEEYQSRQEDGLSRQAQDLVERDKDLCPSQQVSEEGLLRGDRELLQIDQDDGDGGGVSVGVWPGTVNRLQACEPRYDVDTQILTEASRLPHDNKAKVLLEANENQESRERTSDNADLHLAMHRPPLVTGVRGWLQNLGLGKYAQQFEAHEVDSEVLPLLTFDDLKEMGITAVGSRRKLFYAIQQLGKCLLVKTD